MATPDTDVGEYDQYWRLASYQKWTKATLLGALQSSGIVVSRSLTRHALIGIKHRLDRAMVYYGDQRISTDELRKFVRDRGLSLPTPATRKALVNVLVAADETRTFDRFQDLPPELREDIYKLYFDAFPEKLICPTQPPLTRTNRLIREEALPIFYKSIRFQLAFFYGQSQSTSDETINKGTLRPDFPTTAFLHQLSARPDQILRKVVIDIGVASIEGFRFLDSSVLISAELTVKPKKGQIDKDISRMGRKPKKGKELVANVRSELKRSLRGCSKRAKEMLKLKDIYAARRAAENGFL
ncbi:uncharacterized protein MYCFIDRAFT_195093 [Pseudocercospora fijiensis CIRAD86]|uniref:Uncharacterized protein n=1 Tax=Pseudocercospora fijiensis (strain CIRAD86) TaxID=383855 RepID=M2ZY62_PSEFD|nr:uncharacterized protein MYCFIDRAFT_195093 [Pseudocercospora fijiensis CIRAD86]EME83889.1 hypothetical protein MYCFIDRAFT_195093 [Pseudocercospora fijiensis CIRAD86]